MFEAATVVLGTAAVWVLMGGSPVHRIRGPRTAPRPRRAGARIRRTAPVLAGAVGTGVALAVLGLPGGAVAAAVCAGWWIRSRRHRRGAPPVTAELPVAVGLLASGVRAGATVPSCLSAVARSTSGRLGEELAVVAERLRLGADPTSAWRGPALPEPLVAVGRDLARAADTGAPVADLLDRHAVDLRRASRARALARMERLGVLVVAPLGLCFLPAFVLIGIVPLAAELLSQALSA
ncbi:type II secretion system F family protein [Nocardiopsis sp. FIRDI 009]|uniref:type II secretion system F family protein n=1 Tax=Nocardiopsis sp. FIRDI 009 TaxID=714197 RepID=UPI000E263B6D|nr:type II secretion system F family protein [Nocardiopsis sp. FIRDI 009]